MWDAEGKLRVLDTGCTDVFHPSMTPWGALDHTVFLLFPDNTLQGSHVKVAPPAPGSFTIQIFC